MDDPMVELQKITNLMSIALDGPLDLDIHKSIMRRLDCLTEQLQMTAKQKQKLQRAINQLKELQDWIVLSRQESAK